MCEQQCQAFVTVSLMYLESCSLYLYPVYFNDRSMLSISDHCRLHNFPEGSFLRKKKTRHLEFMFDNVICTFSLLSASKMFFLEAHRATDEIS